MPGQFDENSRPVAQDSSATENVVPKAKKTKKKKNKNTDDTAKTLTIPTEYHSESSEQMVPKSRNIKRSPQPQTPDVTPVPETSSSRTLRTATISLDTDDSWTQVGPRRSRKSSALRPSAESQSEASFTTSQKGEPSPVRNAGEDDPHDSFLLQQSALPSSSWDLESRKALVENLLPQPRKTGEEDLPHSQSLSQANRDTPLPNEKAVAGFSWADYEDVRVTTDGGENDADGEDDGWGVVTSKRPRRLNMSSTSHSSSQPLRAPETLTKKQRQNAQKREQQKAAKVEAETQRLATLAGHKRGIEKVRMEELFSKASSSKPSGGMKASVDERGKLIWE